MIIQKTIKTKIKYAEIKKYRDLGYYVPEVAIQNGEKMPYIEIDIKHKNPNSLVKVNCICDKCGLNYKCRLKNKHHYELCTKCRRKKSSKSKLVVVENFSKEEIIDCLEKFGYRKTISKLNTTGRRLSNFIKLNNIEYRKYQGRIIEPPSKEILKEYKNKNVSISEIKRLHNVQASSVIKRWYEEYNLNPPLTKFEIWKIEYEKILNNIDFYVNLNKNEEMDLLSISKEYKISLGQLNKAFKETNNKIFLHSYNKSKGEKEVRKFINDLGFDGVSVKLNNGELLREIDCFIKNKNFAIEYCGEFWHSTAAGTLKNYHLEKTKWAESLNIFLVHIFASEWKYKRQAITALIYKNLNILNEINVTNTKIKKVDENKALKFHNKYNLSIANIKDNEHYGLYFKNKLLILLSLKNNSISKITFRSGYNVNNGLISILNYIDLGEFIYDINNRIENPDEYKEMGFELFKDNIVPEVLYFDKNRPKEGLKLDYKNINEKYLLKIYNSGYTHAIYKNNK